MGKLFTDSNNNIDENSEQKYLPETVTDGGSIATGGAITVDSLTVHTATKGYVDIDFSALGYTYPLSITHWALIVGGTTVFDSGYSATQPTTAQELRDSLVSNLSTNPLPTGFESVNQGATTIRIQTNTGTNAENGTVVKLYLRTSVLPRFEGSYATSGTVTNISGTFSITLDGTTYTSETIDVNIANNAVSEMAEIINDHLSGLTRNSTTNIGYVLGAGTSPTKMLPNGFVSSVDGSGNLVVERDSGQDTALDFDLTFDFSGFTVTGGGSAPLFNPTSTYFGTEDFNSPIANGKSLNTAQIDFQIGTTVIASLIQSNNDFSETDSLDEIILALSNAINATENFSDQGSGTGADYAIGVDQTLRFDTTTKTAIYNNETPSIVIQGDGSIATSSPSVLTGGSAPQTGLTGSFGTIRKARKISGDNGVINLKGFGSFIIVSEWPTSQTTQNDFFSLAANVVTVSPNNGIGFTLQISNMVDGTSFYVRLDRIMGSGAKYISNTPADHVVFKVTRNGPNLELRTATLGDPAKSTANGWLHTDDSDIILASDAIGYASGNFFRFTFPQAQAKVISVATLQDDGGLPGPVIDGKVISDTENNTLLNSINTKLNNKTFVLELIGEDSSDCEIGFLRLDGDA